MCNFGNKIAVSSSWKEAFSRSKKKWKAVVIANLLAHLAPASMHGPRLVNNNPFIWLRLLSGLYGANNAEAAQIDIVGETVIDIVAKIMPIAYEKDEKKKVITGHNLRKFL